MDADGALPEPSSPPKRWLRGLMGALGAVIILGLLLPESPRVPVEGADSGDWHPESYWYEPWGSSGVHKGIDIFADRGRGVVSSTAGLVVYAGTLAKGGKVVLVLGPKWRVHYYAHLDQQLASNGQWLWAGERLGTVGTSGNAVGKSPHLHYSIVSLLPLPWQFSGGTQGWKKMFYLNPTDRFE